MQGTGTSTVGGQSRQSRSSSSKRLAAVHRQQQLAAQEAEQRLAAFQAAKEARAAANRKSQGRPTEAARSAVRSQATGSQEVTQQVSVCLFRWCCLLLGTLWQNRQGCMHCKVTAPIKLACRLARIRWVAAYILARLLTVQPISCWEVEGLADTLCLIVWGQSLADIGV